MARFEYRERPSKASGFLFSVCAFLLMAFLLVQGISSFSEDTVRRQKESLENALVHDVVYCYTVEGTYPQSLEYLKENYGLTYNEDLFFVDYRINGSNIFPDITIIEREG